MKNTIIYSLSALISVGMASASEWNGYFDEDEALRVALALSAQMQQPTDDMEAKIAAISSAKKGKEEEEEKTTQPADNSNTAGGQLDDSKFYLPKRDALSDLGILKTFQSVKEKGAWTYQMIAVASFCPEAKPDIHTVCSVMSYADPAVFASQNGLKHDFISRGKDCIAQELAKEYAGQARYHRNKLLEEAEKEIQSVAHKEREAEQQEIDSYKTCLKTIGSWKEAMKNKFIDNIMIANKYADLRDKAYHLSYKDFALLYRESAMSVKAYMNENDQGIPLKELIRMYDAFYPAFKFGGDSFDQELQALENCGREAKTTHRHLNHNATGADIGRIKMLQDLYAKVVLNPAVGKAENQRAMVYANQGKACSWGLEARLIDMLMDIVEGNAQKRITDLEL
ncbi:MAG: hypothetical protein ACPGXY_06850 [Alphaproteobacteria bacterium]